jgi:hypothetical protein
MYASEDVPPALPSAQGWTLPLAAGYCWVGL